MAKKTRFHEHLVVVSSFAQILTSDHPTPFCFMVLSCSSLLGTVFWFFWQPAILRPQDPPLRFPELSFFMFLKKNAVRTILR
jgi:hypothetical protein